MIALYLSWDRVQHSVVIEPGSPTSRNKLEESPETVKKIFDVMVKLHTEWRMLPFVVREVTDKGIRLPPPNGALCIETVVWRFQRELGPDFNVSEKP